MTTLSEVFEFEIGDEKDCETFIFFKLGEFTTVNANILSDNFLCQFLIEIMIPLITFTHFLSNKDLTLPINSPRQLQNALDPPRLSSNVA